MKVNLNNKKVFFVGDFHLGVPDRKNSIEREKKIISWIESIENEMAALFLLGDIFDFWFEYKSVVPKGYVRLLAKLALLNDKGIPVHYFTGNHDMWIFDYLPEETGIILHKKAMEFEISGKNFFIAHGDGLGPDDYGYKFIKKIFSLKISRFLFATLHPYLGMKLANLFSKTSRETSLQNTFLGEENERLIQFCKDYLKKNEKINFFIFGHRHIPIDFQINKDCRYINTGDWLVHFSFAEFDGYNLKLKKYK